jgi:hypothetical protein
MKEKNIKISEEVHKQYKDYCVKNGLKLNVFLDKILREYLEKNVGKKKQN